MSITNNTHTILNKIEELKNEVPNDWARYVARCMGVSETAVRFYAKGEKGLRSGRHIDVLEHLTEYHNEHVKKIKKLTA